MSICGPSRVSNDPTTRTSSTNILTLGRDQRFVVPKTDSTSNASLIQHGFLSDAPLRPTFAFSLNTLEFFRCLRNRKASYSLQAFTRTLCDLHNESWRPAYTRHFSQAFDVYLSILRQIDTLVAEALKQDTPNYRLLHSCPSCQYKLNGEPDLEYGLLLSIDGNNSLKRFASASSRRLPTFDSDYYIPPSKVDLLAGEVVRRVVTKKPKKSKGKGKKKKKTDVVEEPVIPDGDEDVEMELADGTEDTEEHVVMAGQINPAGQIEAEGASGGLDEIVSACVERWKAAADDRKKGMFKCFEESGVFVGACHHGFILKVVDMILSGEL